MVPAGPQYYAPPPVPLGPDGYPYRPSLSAYQYPLKAMFAMPSFHDFADENADYGLHGASYSLLSQDSVGVAANYTAANNGRGGWTTNAQLPKNNNTLFLEQDQPYNQGQYPTTNYPIRSMSNSESKNMSLSSMASALPLTNDRLLPYPSSGRQPQGSYLRSNDGHNVLQGSFRNMDGVHSYNQGLVSASLMNTVKTLNHNSVSENSPMSAPYIPLSTNNPEPVGSSQMGCGSQYISSTQPADLYAPTSSNGLYRQQNDSSSSLSNGYSPSSRKPSQTSDNSSPATTLSNGHPYVPYVSQSYPQPPMEEMPLPINHHRSSDAGIQAS
jgi:hypothetical protein